jgi:hypothetical protein
VKTKPTTLVCFALTNLCLCAHDWHPHRDSTHHHVTSAAGVALSSAIAERKAVSAARVAALVPSASPAVQKLAAVFSPFKPAVRYRWDASYFYVESEGMPAHPMMVGITQWIGRFPLPQDYTGNNAWRIPLSPVPAAMPLSASSHFFRGAIAMAANGVPIFNPLTTDGRDTYLAGELDDFGGHAGNGEDYHYHTAPLHLQTQLGPRLPLGFALDGYPLYGLLEPDGSSPGTLDAFNGHTDAQGNYHYHCSKTYPYVNGGFHGQVTEIGGQVDPQPRVVSPVPQPLGGARDAVFTAFTNSAPDRYSTTYRLNGQSYIVNWVLNRAAGTVQFEFINPNGSATTKTYSGWKSAPVSATRKLGLMRVAPHQIQLQLVGEPNSGYELSSSVDLAQWTPQDFVLLDSTGLASLFWNIDSGHQFVRTR